jgi:hypothetical protein
VAYKPASLPPERQSPDARVEEVMAYRRESARTVFRKIRDGAYESYKSGENRLILWSSVIEDRKRCVELGPQLAQRAPTSKRKPGRPRKSPKTQTPAPPERRTTRDREHHWGNDDA